MGLLEKLRSQPKWKHADPTVRLEGLQSDEIPDEDLIALATEDSDARVRRSAIGRVTDAGALASIVRNDSDASAREQAIARLATLAEQGDEHVAPGAVSALASLGRQRELANIARASTQESVRRAAVEHVDDPRALGSVARHAQDASTRLLALERLNDPAELEAVAARGEHPDAAVGALERLDSPTDELLNGLIQRARTKVVQKRARSILRAREEAARPQATAPSIEFKDADQQRARELADQMESIAATPDMATLHQTYATLRVTWV
jgi:hypothetical protein